MYIVIVGGGQQQYNSNTKNRGHNANTKSEMPAAPYDNSKLLSMNHIH